MNEVLKQMLFSFVRFGLAAVSTWMVSKGIISSEQGESLSQNGELIAGIVGVILTSGLIVWSNLKKAAEKNLLKAKADMSEVDLQSMKAKGVTASAIVPPTAVPKTIKGDSGKKAGLLLIGVLSLSPLLPACALVQSNPSQEAQDSLHDRTRRAVDVVTITANTLTALVREVEVLESRKALTPTQARTYIAQARAQAPRLRAVLAELKAVNDEPGLTTTIGRAMQWLNPYIVSLENATDGALQAYGRAIRVALALLGVSSGGVK